MWSPSEAPDVVILTTDDIHAPTGIPPDCAPLTGAIVGNEHHLVLAQDAARLRLCLRPAPTDRSGYLIIERDSHALARLAAATRFERATRSRRLTLDQSAIPTGYQRARLALLLTLSDALDAGASTRDVAFGLIMPHHRPLSVPDWKGSGERRHVLRLIAEGRRLVNGGYRKLLRRT